MLDEYFLFIHAYSSVVVLSSPLSHTTLKRHKRVPSAVEV